MKLGESNLRVRPVPIHGADAAARLAINKLRELAGECAECGGSGQVCEDFELYLLTDDARRTYRGHYARTKNDAPVLEAKPRACVAVGKPCDACADVRQVVKLCEAAL